MANSSAIECFHNLNLNRFYRIYTTVHEMMANRGYTPVEMPLKKSEWISRYVGFLADLEDNVDIFQIIDQLILLFQFGKKRLLVYFHPLDSKLCQNDMSYIQKLMTQKEAKCLVIVANSKATPKVANVLGILGHNAQLFEEDTLVSNPTKHQLVPEHTRLTGEEKDRVLEAYGTLPDKQVHSKLFPGLESTDPIAKYYNFKIGDLIQVKRPRVDGFYDLYYRVVVNPSNEKDK
jgi:DNA-directed RNA polymerase subunit H (RpoH/RPB5)